MSELVFWKLAVIRKMVLVFDAFGVLVVVGYYMN